MAWSGLVIHSVMYINMMWLAGCSSVVPCLVWSGTILFNVVRYGVVLHLYFIGFDMSFIIWCHVVWCVAACIGDGVYMHIVLIDMV